MVLWSTKDNPLVKVNDHEWKPFGRPAFDSDGATAMEGMVAAWWYDGQKMLEPLILEESRIVVISENHPDWPYSKGGIVASITEENIQWD